MNTEYMEWNYECIEWNLTDVIMALLLSFISI